MRRFLEDSEAISFPHPEMYNHEFSPVFSTRPVQYGSISESVIGSEESFMGESMITMPNHYKRALFSAIEVNNLREMYSKMYQVPANSIEAGCAFKKYATILMKGKHIGCKSTRSKNSSIVLVHWNEDLLGPNLTSEQYRPVSINFFIEQSIQVEERTYTPYLFSVSWFKLRPDKDIFGKPVTIWECDIFDTSAPSIIPIQLIKSKTVSLIDKLCSGETVLFTTQCIEF